MNLYDELTQPCVADRALGAIKIRLRRGDSLEQIEADAHRWYAEALALVLDPHLDMEDGDGE